MASKPASGPTSGPASGSASASVAAAAPVGSKPSGLAQELGKKTPFASVQQELCLHLARTAAAAGEPLHACLKRHNLREAAFNVLCIVAGHGAAGVPSQSIAAETVTRVPDITRLVDGLEKRGLVERHRCPVDRRVVHVRITAAGRRLAAAARKQVEEVHRAQFPALDEPRMRELIRLLELARQPSAAPGPNP